MSGLQRVEQVMGMAISFDVREPLPSPEAIDDAMEWLHHVDRTFSPYREDSEVSQFGRGEIAASDLSGEVAEVLSRCIELATVTNGTFDAFATPSPNGTHLDPSGYVKGWSIDRAARILERDGAKNFCINAGGDLVVIGEASAGHDWRIGIRHPDESDKVALVVEAHGPLAVATSATYERGAHIIDPRTGAPTTELASVTVVGPELGVTDAYATAIFVMGAAGLEWVEDHPDFSAYIISRDGSTHWSSRFPHPSNHAR